MFRFFLFEQKKKYHHLHTDACERIDRKWENKNKLFYNKYNDNKNKCQCIYRYI